MSRVNVIAGALATYLDGQKLDPAPERLRELAEFIDNHLSPEVPQTPEAYLALRMIQAQVNEVLKPRLIGPAHPDAHKPYA